MATRETVGSILIGGLLLLGGAIGLVAVPAALFARIFGSIGTQESMFRELELFNTWMPPSALFSTATYVAGLGLLRRRPWSVRLAMTVLAAQVVGGVAGVVVAPSGLLWLHIAVAGCCLAWFVVPSSRDIVAASAGGVFVTAAGVTGVGGLAIGAGLVYVAVIIGLLRLADSASALSETSLVLLPSMVVGVFAFTTGLVNRWPSLGLLSSIAGGMMVSLALGVSALRPPWLQQQPNAVLESTLGSWLSSETGIQAVALALRLVLHLFLVGAILVVVGGALSVARLPASASKLKQRVGAGLIVIVVAGLQVLQLPVSSEIRYQRSWAS